MRGPQQKALRLAKAMLLLALVAAGMVDAGAAGLALQSVPLALPAGQKQEAPFDQPRTLRLPQGFTPSLVARVHGARFLALAPDGRLLVSVPGSGRIEIIEQPLSGQARVSEFVSGLRNPHDMVFHVLGGVTWLYVAESNRIIRSQWQPQQARMGKPEVVVDHLPDESSPELKGSYGHQLKNIALAGNKLYVSIASTCNACDADVKSDPVRNAIYEYDADGRNRRLYARGLRNAEGLAFRPGTKELWVVVNNRDNIAYPLHKDFDGDGRDDYGRVLPAYVDGHPPELLVKLRDGANYGWPYCNSNPDAGLDNMPYDRDVQHNADGSKLDCSKLDRPIKGMTAHSAPLGMSFLPASMPAPMAGGIAVAQHGCWNCTALNGHRIVLFSLGADGKPGAETELISGWLVDAKKRQRWGRPVDVIPDGQGGLFISDDYAGAVYRMAPVRR